MNEFESVQQREKEELRWRLLRLIYISGERAVGDLLILKALTGIVSSISLEKIRTKLDYLEDKGLIEVERRSTEWLAKITASGTDAVEGNTPMPVGIAKPEDV